MILPLYQFVTGYPEPIAWFMMPATMLVPDICPASRCLSTGECDVAFLAPWPDLRRLAADPGLNLTAPERKSNLSKSIEYLNRSIDKLKSLEMKDDQKYFLLSLSDAYKESGDYKSA